MADKAQAEPTMEEILASIRKIIADDGDGAQPARPAPQSKPSVAVNVSEEDDFDDLSLDDVLDDTGSEAEALSESADDEFPNIGMDDESTELLADVDEDMFEQLAADTEAAQKEDAPSSIEELEDFDFEAVNLDADEPVIEQANAEEETFDDPVAEWDMTDSVVEQEEISAPAFEPRPDPQPAAKESAMLRGKTESAPSQASSGLTDERIAGAAASALGKLMVKQSEDDGNPNTLDGMMREMLRPMIKEWLDANLPGIVERKVEEEVRRIARMAG